MADFVIAIVVDRIASIIEEQIRNEVNLVRGVEKELLDLSNELKKIRIVLDDAERRRFKERSINDWLSRLEQTSYEMEDVLDEWNYAILKLKIENGQSDNDDVVSPPKQKVCCFIPPSPCLCLKKVVVRYDIAKKIKAVKKQLDQILVEKDRYKFGKSQPDNTLPESWRVQSTSLIDLAEVHGRDNDRDILLSKFMSNASSHVVLGLHVLCIVGVGGIGKTTLAQLVYNDSKVKKYFDLRIWICVSDPFDVGRIAKGIIESVGKGSSPTSSQLDVLIKHLIDSVSGKKFLLILDDVWTEDSSKWEPLKNALKCGGVGSKILVTTRNERVAKLMGTIDNDIHRLGQLSDEDCWLLLHRVALSGRNQEKNENFHVIGKNIANKCKGLPLAAKALGSLLRFKNSLEEWENVLNSEIWQLEEAEVELFPHLLLSYNELSPPLKRCFSHSIIFPKDHEIGVEGLIEIWIALGCLGINENGGSLELRGRNYFENLAMRSLFQDFKRSDVDGQIQECKMHDIVHDFAQFLWNNGRVEAAEIKTTVCQTCNPLLASHVKAYRTLFVDDEAPPKFCDCLTSLRVLSLTRCGLQSIPEGMESLIHLRMLIFRHDTLSNEDLKIICTLYNLQTLGLINCDLEEIPSEIGNLVHLRHLELSDNESLEELPGSICRLHSLQSLNIQSCCSLGGLPEGMHRLINLKHLYNLYTKTLEQFPRSLARLTDLRTLHRFHGGRNCSNLGWLKNLNRLSDFLQLEIILTDDGEDVVENARKAELRKKIHIQTLGVIFEDKMEENETSVRMGVFEALEPHPYLGKLFVWHYKGSQLPGWITSPLNQLREVHLNTFDHLSSLPALGKLPCLEKLFIKEMHGFRFLGREFLGITRGNMDIESSSSSSSGAINIVGFPKLKKLHFFDCSKWEEWEDISNVEEETATVLLMPCLKKLHIILCHDLMALPHCLLRKVSSLKELELRSFQLHKLYGDKEGSDLKSIVGNPSLRVKF